MTTNIIISRLSEYIPSRIYTLLPSLVSFSFSLIGAFMHSLYRCLCLLALSAVTRASLTKARLQPSPPPLLFFPPPSPSSSPSSLHLLSIILFSVSSLRFYPPKPDHSAPLICISSQTQEWEPEDISTSAVVVDTSSTTINSIAIRRGLERPSLLRFQKTLRNTAVSLNQYAQI